MILRRYSEMFLFLFCFCVETGKQNRKRRNNFVQCMHAIVVQKEGIIEGWKRNENEESCVGVCVCVCEH